MPRIVAVLLISLQLVLSLAQKPCVPKVYPGADNNVVCVCNATYCDEFPALGTIQKGHAVVYKSSLSGARFARTDIQFGAPESAGTVLKFDASVQFQQIFGFGGAFTDSTGINLQTLSAQAQQMLLQQYFSKEQGIGYTVGRVPMASCDFSTHEYSYANTENDFDLEWFNLTNEDFALKIPTIKAATKLVDPSEGLRLFTTPWSAPAWMKSNGHMKGGGTLKGDLGGEYYKTWAQYFLKFFKAYESNGVKFWGLSIQNEPSSGLDPVYQWQAMFMGADMERDFLKNDLGPVLKGSSTTKDLKIMIYSDQRPGIMEYVKTVMDDPKAAALVDGVAFHWYEDYLAPASNIGAVHKAYPNTFLLPTEACTGYMPLLTGVRMGEWARGDVYAHSIIEDLQNFAVGWIDWNLCLNVQGGPNWVGNFVDAPIIVSNTSDEFYKQPMFYVLGHFSKLVRPGSHRVQLLDENGNLPTAPVEAVAFVTPQKERIAVILNRDKAAHVVSLMDADAAGQALSITSEPRSISTVVWNAF